MRISDWSSDVCSSDLVGDSNILIDGFMDWVVDNDVNSKGEYHANLHFNPQVKYDLGKALNFGEKQLYVGVEYDYWKDKYGRSEERSVGKDGVSTCRYRW